MARITLNNLCLVPAPWSGNTRPIGGSREGRRPFAAERLASQALPGCVSEQGMSCSPDAGTGTGQVTPPQRQFDAFVLLCFDVLGHSEKALKLVLRGSPWSPARRSL